MKKSTKDKKDKKGRASFKRAGKKFGAAPPSNAATDGSDRDPEDRFLGYDLTPLPREAFPDRSKPNQGKLSYTIDFSGARVEVLLEKKAYFIKVVSPGFPGPKGQITWSKYGEGGVSWFSRPKGPNHLEQIWGPPSSLGHRERTIRFQ